MSTDAQATHFEEAREAMSDKNVGRRHEQGFALILAILALMLLTFLGLTLATSTSTELRIASQLSLERAGPSTTPSRHRGRQADPADPQLGPDPAPDPNRGLGSDDLDPARRRAGLGRVSPGRPSGHAQLGDGELRQVRLGRGLWRRPARRSVARERLRERDDRPRIHVPSCPQRRLHPVGPASAHAEHRDGGSVQGRQRHGQGRRDGPDRRRSRAVLRWGSPERGGAQQPRSANHRGLGAAPGPAGSLRES
jgi:hypothetical protein